MLQLAVWDPRRTLSGFWRRLLALGMHWYPKPPKGSPQLPPPMPDQSEET